MFDLVLFDSVLFDSVLYDGGPLSEGVTGTIKAVTPLGNAQVISPTGILSTVVPDGNSK